MRKTMKQLGWWSACLGLALSTLVLPLQAGAQNDPREDPPSRVARLGYMEGSVSFQPAGETDWVQAVPNRPMTTGDRLWADQNSRAELQLGSAVIRLSANTGFSFLNLDDRTVQIQLTSGELNVRVRRLGQNDVFEVDTPNLAFSIYRPGSYRVEASEDGNYSIVSLRQGEGEATGNGQTYTLYAGQRGTFSGTDSLSADVEDIGAPDQFDNWAYNRDHRYDHSRSAQYLSHDVVGYEDLDDNGDWRDDSNYGHVWFPTRVAPGWAPYHEGHWDWIPPWGYTWVDDSAWGYAPFHYGRWVTVGGRWGWVAGPVAVRAVYAPALVVFIGGGGGFGGNVGWFPLGPREVYVPSYPVSREYVNRVNVSNTTVNNTTITNVYNTTIVNNTTNVNTANVTNVTYVNRSVQGAVTAVPQHAFASAQPVAQAAVTVNAQQIARAPVNVRAEVAPTRESVLGARAATANHVTAPPPAVQNRQVIAKTQPPPPPVPFARQQQELAAHPGQPLARQQIQSLRPAATAAAAQPLVKQAPPGRPAIPNAGPPATPPGSQPNAGRPGAPASTPPPVNQPANRAMPPEPNNRPAEPNRAAPPPARNISPPAAPPTNRPEMNPAVIRPENNRPENNRPENIHPGNNRPESNRPPAVAEPNRPAPENRPLPNHPPEPPANNRPNPPQSQPEAVRPPVNRPAEPPARTDRPMPQQNNRPEAARPEPNRYPPPPPRPATPAPSERPQPRTPPAETRPVPQPPRPPAKPLTPEEKRLEEERKKQERPPVG